MSDHSEWSPRPQIDQQENDTHGNHSRENQCILRPLTPAHRDSNSSETHKSESLQFPPKIGLGTSVYSRFTRLILPRMPFSNGNWDPTVSTLPFIESNRRRCLWKRGKGEEGKNLTNFREDRLLTVVVIFRTFAQEYIGDCQYTWNKKTNSLKTKVVPFFTVLLKIWNLQFFNSLLSHLFRQRIRYTSCLPQYVVHSVWWWRQHGTLPKNWTCENLAKLVQHRSCTCTHMKSETIVNYNYLKSRADEPPPPTSRARWSEAALFDLG